MDQWEKHEIDDLWDAVEPAVNEGVSRADGFFTSDQDYLDAWLRTAYNVDGMFREAQTKKPSDEVDIATMYPGLDGTGVQVHPPIRRPLRKAACLVG